MDVDRFETVLRGLSASPSRRRALHLLAGSALGGLFGLNVVVTEAGKGGKKKDKKKKDKKKSPPTPPPPPPSPPSTPTNTCVFDSDCNTSPVGPVCCYEEGPPHCEKCCLTDDRGCPDGQICSISTPDVPNICIIFPVP